MKKLLLSFLCLMICIAALCIFADSEALAATIVDSGTCGDNLTWTLDSEGVLTISGTGAMQDYEDIIDVPWYNTRTSILSIVIEEGITSIGRYAFSDCNSLTNIKISDSVSIIKECAFASCYNLKSITFGNGLKRVEDWAFSGPYMTEPVRHIYISDIESWYNIDFDGPTSSPGSLTASLRNSAAKAPCYCKMR